MIQTGSTEKRSVGFRVLTDDQIEEIKRAAFDVILCNNVFEHLRQPGAVLRKLAAGLRPGGVIFCQTLSAQSLSLWFAPTRWLYYGEGHLFIPTLRSLDLYFRGANLRAIRRETHGFRSVSVDASGARVSRKRTEKMLALIAGRAGRGHRVKMLLRKKAPDAAPGLEALPA